jgi:hypothetical protein
VTLFRSLAATAQPASTTYRADLSVTALAVTSHSLYVAGYNQQAWTSVLRVLDVSGSGPSLIGEYSVPTLDHAAMVVDGGLAHAVNRGRLSIVDLSGLGAPRQVGTFSSAETPASYTGIARSSGYDFVLVPSGIAVLNVSNPVHPAFVTTYVVGGSPQHLSGLTGGVLLVSTWEVGQPDRVRIVSLDTSDPQHLNQLGAWTTVAPAWGLCIDDGRAYVVSPRLIHILDTSDPSHLTEVGSIPFEYTYGGGMAACGSILFVAGFDAVHAYDAGDPADPHEITAFGQGEGLASDVAIDGPQLDVGYWEDSGVRVFDIADLSNPQVIARSPMILNGSTALTVATYAGHVLASSYSGLWLLHIP